MATGPSTYDPLRDGYATLITINAAPGVKLYERETTPPSLEGGGPILTTTMRNITWRTKDPKTLKEMGDLMATVCYATSAYGVIMGIINTPTFATLIWPDGANMVVYGYVDKFTPTGHSEGNLPTSNLVFVITNRNPVGAILGPQFNPAP